MTTLVLSALALVCGLILILAALAIIEMSDKLEVSLRTIAALCVTAEGCWLVAISVTLPESLALHDVLFPAGIVLWIIRAAWLRQGQPMRRATDWAVLDGRETH